MITKKSVHQCRRIPVLFSALSVIAILAFIINPLTAQESLNESNPVQLRFLHREGEVLHAEALVNESVFINGLYSHDAVITESSVSVIREVDGEGGAVLDATFRTEERITGRPEYFEWVSSETVRLSRDALGRMRVPADAARPVLRDIPVFPETSVSPGDSWTAAAEEVHVFRIGGLMAGPYRGEIPVAYEYAGDVWNDERRLARILIRYNLYVPVSGPGEPVRLVSGRSDQVLLWDIAAGRPYSKSEDFEFIMMMSNGTIQEFRGQQEVTYRAVMELDREQVTDSIRRTLNDIPGVSVSPVDEGIRLTIEDSGRVLFDPGSAKISPDQHYRLEALKSLLEGFSNRDILITGHTAHFGTREGRYLLSRERAAAVAGILFPEGRSGSGRLYLRGAGSDEPAVPEDSEAARARNRRVEILILD